MLLGLAATFAVINGANDCGAMLATTLKVPGLRMIVALSMYVAALAVVPLVVGTRVADTLTSGLVQAGPALQPWLIAVGVVSAVVVVGALTAWGLPTSLTLGMVGGIVGAGLGRGLPVNGAGVGRVMLVGIAAPVVGGVLAVPLAKFVAAALAVTTGDRLAAMHRLATIVQAFAYAANDGQKILAVMTVTAIGITPWSLAAAALLFAIGGVVGVGAAAGTLGGQILRAGPREQLTAQFSASAAVLGSAALGVPVSMTQSVSGGLVGTGMLRGLRQVRWRAAQQLALAWVLTLPTAALVGAGVAWIGGRIT